MRRIISNVLTFAALTLCAVTVALWIWSYGDVRSLLSDGRFDGDRAWRNYYLVAYRGQLAFELEQISYLRQPTTAPTNRWSAEDAVELYTLALRGFPFHGPLGFHFLRNEGTSAAGSARLTRLGLPLWAVLVVLALPVLIRCGRLLRRYRQRHQKPGCCRKCGYNLTGNVSGRCPECGLET
ncbi:MAG: hypothetical protein JXA69_11010 [Phycisphaerae bacterium]|nr:hypothetical protein [Phycisphaerae bacterium]